MKIRSGFVSNSSSSSFILAYDKTKVLNGPEAIVEYITRNPDADILIRGKELSDGDDIFELSISQRRLIRKFSKRFIQYNQGERIHTDYIYDSPDETSYHKEQKMVPNIVGYVNYRLWGTPFDWKEPEVDMSDVENPKIELNEMLDPTKRDDTYEARREKSENYYRIKEQRTREARVKAKRDLQKEAIEDISSHDFHGIISKKEDVVSEEVYKDNRSSDEDYTDLTDFAERYLTDEAYDDGCGTVHNDPYVILCWSRYTDRQIVWDNIMNGSEPYFLCWRNPVFEYLTGDSGKYLVMYRIGPDEKKVLRENKDAFFGSERECTLYIDPRIVKTADGGRIEEDDLEKEMEVVVGEISVIDPGQDTVDFKAEFIQDKEV